MNVEKIYQKIVSYPATRDNLIPILQDVQDLRGFIDPADIEMIGRHLKLPTSKIYGVATFYNQFRLNKPGKFQISVCRGTACHVKGSARILAAIKSELKVDSGATTRDGLFTLNEVACIGACSIAPVIMIGDQYYGHLTVKATIEIIESIRSQAAEIEAAAAAAAAPTVDGKEPKQS